MNTEFAQHLGATSMASLGSVTGELPGLVKPSALGSLKKLVPGGNKNWWNPTAVRGVGSAQESEFFLSQFGEDLGWYVEYMNRVPAFINYLRRGWDPAAAGSRVKLMQVDYLNTASGDQVMRRLIPFFAFLKGQTTFLAKELTTKPGGALSQTIQAEARGHKQLPPFSPEYVQNSAAIPGETLPTSIFGTPAPDSKRVLTSLGMMHEDPLQFLATDPDHPIRSLWKGPLREGMGRLNPLAQLALEKAFGQSLWQAGPRGGRDLTTMDPTLGRLFSNITGADEPYKLGPLEDVAKLAAGRWTSTAKTLTTDPKRKNWATKALNTLSGLRVTDIPPASRESQMREKVQQLMKEMGGRGFEVVNISQEEMDTMSPEDLRQAQLLKLLSKILGERGKRRAAAR